MYMVMSFSPVPKVAAATCWSAGLFRLAYFVLDARDLACYPDSRERCYLSSRPKRPVRASFFSKSFEASMVPFASFLVSLRQLNGLSQRQLARHLGVSHTHVQRIERGQVLPDTPQLRQFAEVLGIRADVLARASLGAGQS
jgi:ribosome-binding protein aMBF1 (putative translation factor)